MPWPCLREIVEGSFERSPEQKAAIIHTPSLTQGPGSVRRISFKSLSVSEGSGRIV